MSKKGRAAWSAAHAPTPAFRHSTMEDLEAQARRQAPFLWQSEVAHDPDHAKDVEVGDGERGAVLQTVAGLALFLDECFSHEPQALARWSRLPSPARRFMVAAIVSGLAAVEYQTRGDKARSEDLRAAGRAFMEGSRLCTGHAVTWDELREVPS